MSNEAILTKILNALATARPETARILTYIFDQIESGKREDDEVRSLAYTANLHIRKGA